MNPLNIDYEVEFQVENSYSRLAKVRFNSKEIETPFLWLCLSTGESIDFQKEVFKSNNIEGVMTNAYDLMYQDTKNERQNLLKELRNKNNIKIKCDSGGFQNLTKKKELDQKEVFLIQTKINADIAVQLDYPLLPEASENTNLRRIEKTIKNFELLLNMNDNSSILPTIHGYNEKMLIKSLKGIEDILGGTPSAVAVGSLVPFLFTMDGSAKIGGKKKAIEIIMKVREMLPKTFLHVLGAGGTMSYLLFYLGVDSMDNTGWVKKAGYGAIQMPGISDRFIYKTEKRRSLDDDELALKSWLDCLCPACSSTSDRSKFYGRSKSSRLLRSLHNVYVYQSEILRARKYIREGRMKEFVRNRLENSTYKKLLDYIDNF